MTSTIPTEAGYERVKAQRATLYELIERQRGVVADLGLATQTEALARLAERVESDAFKVMIVGVFKAGKSTLINALIGQKILPAYAIPTTAIINEVKWAEQPRAVLYPLEGHGDGPMDVPVQELESYVAIDEFDDQKENPYERAEVYWPLELCRNGVEIIDSPGLEEDERREWITQSYLPRVDAVVFVFLPKGKLSKSERSFVRAAVQPTLGDSLFFVCNRINEVEPDERDRVIRYTRKTLAEFADRDDRVFFVDARGALQARERDDYQSLEASGLPVAEKRLEHYLANERGRAKIIGPGQKLQNSLHEARRHIAEHEAMLGISLEELQRRYEEARQPLADLERERQLIMHEVDLHLSETARQTETMTREFFERTASDCLDWASQLELENKPGLNPRKVKERQEALVEEIATKVGDRVEQAFVDWEENQLRTLVGGRVEALQERIGDKVESFTAHVDDLRLDLSGVDTKVELGAEEASGVQRLMSSAAAIMFADIGSAYIGARSGFKPMLQGLLPQIAVGLAGFAIGLGPLGLPALLLASGVIQVMVRSERAVGKMKEKVAQETAQTLRQRAQDDSKRVADEVVTVLGDLRTSLDQALQAEIQSIREQADVVVAERQQGEEQVRATRRQLRDHERTINEIDEALDGLIAEAGLA